MGMNIGDFAESLMESGAINSKPEQRANPAAPKEVPQKDISDVKVSNNFINSVLTESFGVPESSEIVAEEVVEPAPQQQLNEKILDLKEELKDTILMDSSEKPKKRKKKRVRRRVIKKRKD
jgi:hypothetical protein